MKEELILFETAKLAKEKNFRGYSRGWYSYEEGNPLRLYDKENYNGIVDCFLAPSQSILQKWLRETHRIWVEIYMNNDIPNKGESYSYLVLTKNGGVVVHNIGGGNFTTYEEALEIGLQEALKLI